MDMNEKLSNASILIDQLNKENEELKRKNSELELKLTFQETDYDEVTEKARNIIETCERSMKEYKEATAAMNKAKEEYQAAIKEIYELKLKYKKAVKKIINQFDT